MKIITAILIAQLFLIVTGSDDAGERKRVTCYYMGSLITPDSSLQPEDLDPSICTHLVYLHGAINEETEEIYLRQLAPELKTGGTEFVPRLTKLKEENPDLKLLLGITEPDFSWISKNPSRRAKIIRSAVKWLNESGFDGLEMAVYRSPADKEGTADFFCEMKAEFDKYGYIVSAIFMENSFSNPSDKNTTIVSKIASCCDYIALRSSHTDFVTHRAAPMSLIKSNVDAYIQRGLPQNKTLIIVPAIGILLTLDDPQVNGLGANASGPGLEDPEQSPLVRNRELLKRMNDSSLGWTFRRDNETMEPYAFTTTGLWTSYEDATSMEFKARYVLEKGLGGIAINLLETDDLGYVGDEGRFPLTRAAYNSFSRGRVSPDRT